MVVSVHAPTWSPILEMTDDLAGSGIEKSSERPDWKERSFPLVFEILQQRKRRQG